MTGQERFEDNFEKEWRSAFDGMEKAPPPSVWSEIDRQLAYEELAVYKSREIYYRWLAAAVILIAMFFGIIQFMPGGALTDDKIGQAINVDEPTHNTYDFKLPVFERKKEGKDRQSDLLALHSDEKGTEEAIVTPEPPLDLDKFLPFELVKVNPKLIVAANFEEKEVFKISTYDFHKRKGGKKDNEKYWAGIGMSRGSFEPNFHSGGNTFASDAASPVGFSQANNEAVDRNAPDVREGMTSGGTVSLGLNFGIKMGDRWSLESGVQYARSDATTTTNVVIETTTIREVIPASSEVKNVPQVQRAISEQKVIEYDYKDVDLANEFQFATVPLKAGYLLVDSKLKVEVNAGFAANIYLGNKLTAPDDQLASVTFGPGSSSPYRELSFSGLAGVQVGYEFFNNFDLVVEPNYRRSINSLTKDNSTFTATPSGFGVMTGIRYRFN